jgi:hypothetical protein
MCFGCVLYIWVCILYIYTDIHVGMCFVCVCCMRFGPALICNCLCVARFSSRRFFPTFFSQILFLIFECFLFCFLLFRWWFSASSQDQGFQLNR